MENEVARRIKAVRERYGLTQEQLASDANVTKACVSRWENGQIKNLKAGSIRRICDKYKELNPAWFLGGDAPMLRQSDRGIQLTDEINARLSAMNDEQLAKVIKFIDEFL